MVLVPCSGVRSWGGGQGRQMPRPGNRQNSEKLIKKGRKKREKKLIERKLMENEENLMKFIDHLINHKHVNLSLIM